MTIITKAAWTAKYNVCEGGTARTAAALEANGLTMDDEVSMQDIMRTLGLSDTLFSFCKVKRGCEPEAQRVLGEFMRAVVGYALRWITFTRSDLSEALVQANKAINKRCDGISRPALLAQEYAKINDLYRVEHEPKIKYWLDVYRCVLSNKPDHLAATHAAIALMDGADVMKMRNAVHEQLCAVLNNLLETGGEV